MTNKTDTDKFTIPGIDADITLGCPGKADPEGLVRNHDTIRSHPGLWVQLKSIGPQMMGLDWRNCDCGSTLCTEVE